MKKRPVFQQRSENGAFYRLFHQFFVEELAQAAFPDQQRAGERADGTPVKLADIWPTDAEVADLTKKYGMPDGRLYVAWCDGQPAGCIALRRLDGTTCELKRLYVRPAFRGRGIAGVMMQRILDDARAIGYTVMLLDTLPFLTSAIRMYRALGFYDIPPYNDSPLDTTICLRLDL